MMPDWRDFEARLKRLQTHTAAMRPRCGELDRADLEALLSALSGCAMELIGLRSALHKLFVATRDSNAP